AAHQFVKRLERRDLLVVAVAARVIVGPRDAGRDAIVGNVTRLIRIEVIAVKEMGAPDAAESTQRGAEVLMIARRQETSASLVKTCDAGTVNRSQPLANFYGKQPKLIKVAGIERA